MAGSVPEIDYTLIAGRIEGRDFSQINDDSIAIMALFGYFTVKKQDTIIEYWINSEQAWFKLPDFTSADHAAEWVTRWGGQWEDMGYNGIDSYYAGLHYPGFGNDYGNSKWLGSAMWGAFIRLIGKVGGEDED